MIKVTELSENEIKEIGEAFADYNYADGEKGMSFLYNGRDSVKEYICGYVRAMLAGGCLFSTSDKHEAFVAYKFSKDKLPASAGFILLKTVLLTLGFKGAVNMLSAIKKGGESYETTLKKQKNPIFSLECWWFASSISVRDSCEKRSTSPLPKDVNAEYPCFLKLTPL